MEIINKELIIKIISELYEQSDLLSNELSEKQEKLDDMFIDAINSIEYYELDAYVKMVANKLSHIDDAILNLNYVIYDI